MLCLRFGAPWQSARQIVCSHAIPQLRRSYDNANDKITAIELHAGELIISRPDVIRVTRSVRRRWAARVAGIGGMKFIETFGRQTLTERTICKRQQQILCTGINVKEIGCERNGARGRGHVNMEIKRWV